MNGWINLVGSGEYLPVMNEIDRFLLDRLALTERKPRVACLATAAGREGDTSVNRWLSMGVQHFQDLGAEVTPVRVINRETADDPHWESALEEADLIYFSGGDPSYLYETMKDSCAWLAAQRAWERGAIYAGCSAGAMILGKRIPGFRLGGMQEGFGIVPATYVIPHFDAIPGIWKPLILGLQKQLKRGERMVGIDENTALLGKRGGPWHVMGAGAVHIFESHRKTSHASGETLTFE